MLLPASAPQRDKTTRERGTGAKAITSSHHHHRHKFVVMRPHDPTYHSLLDISFPSQGSLCYNRTALTHMLLRLLSCPSLNIGLSYHLIQPVNTNTLPTKLDDTTLLIKTHLPRGSGCSSRIVFHSLPHDHDEQGSLHYYTDLKTTITMEK